MKRIVVLFLLSVFVLSTGKAFTVSSIKSSGSYFIYTTSGQKNYLTYKSILGWGNTVNTYVYCRANANCNSHAEAQMQDSAGNPLNTNRVETSDGKGASQSRTVTGPNLYRVWFRVYTNGGYAYARIAW